GQFNLLILILQLINNLELGIVTYYNSNWMAFGISLILSLFWEDDPEADHPAWKVLCRKFCKFRKTSQSVEIVSPASHTEPPGGEGVGERSSPRFSSILFAEFWAHNRLESIK